MFDVDIANGTTFPADVKGFTRQVVLIIRKERESILLLANVATASIYDLSVKRRSVHPSTFDNGTWPIVQ